MKLLLFIIFIFIYLPNNFGQARNLIGTYKGFHSETTWEIAINDNSNFICKADGHIGNVRIEGKYSISGDTLILNKDGQTFNKYLIDGDSCLIDFEYRLDYCKQWPKEGRSRLRNINYPQLDTKNGKLKKDVEWMIQIALNNKKISRFIPDTIDYLIIQEYFEINRNSDLKLNWNGKNVKFLSEEEIKEKNIEKYIIIDEINVGLHSATIYFKMMPEFWNGIITTFEKENGVWKHIEYL